MICKWELPCKFEDTKKCENCFTHGLLYKAKEVKTPKTMKQRRAKADNRMGSNFEKANHDRNVSALRSTESNMTINSGATHRQKGDENITGYIKVSEELKTQMPNRVKGTKTFTIQREWLDKLNKESKQRGQEFWYLVFAFSENESMNPAGDTFVVAEKDMIFNMVTTMVEDRRRADLAAQKADIALKENDVLKAEIDLLHTKLALTEAKLKLQHMENK